jgi:hypothetical protein
MGGIISQQSDTPPSKLEMKKQNSFIASLSKLKMKRQDSFDDEIDVDKLFSALLKLSFTFDVKESMTTNLVAEITNPQYASVDEQFVAVEKWVNTYADTKLQISEIMNLIKYVELFVPSQDNNAFSCDITESSSGNNESKDGSTNSCNNVQQPSCRLMCPYRSEIATWTAEIRRQELNKVEKKPARPCEHVVPTTRLLSMGDDDDDFTSLRFNAARSSSYRIVD